MHPPEIESMDTPEGHQKLLRAQWKGFAAFAWKKYLAEGRGAIVLDLRRASNDESGLKVPAFYIASAGDALAARGGWPDEEIVHAVADYDPEEEIVFIFLRLGGDVFHYTASDDPAPPAAYQGK